MNHTFVGSLTDMSKCRQCKRDEKSHGLEAECESCGRIGPCEIIDKDILACESCQERDKEIQEEISNLGATPQERIRTVKEILEENSKIEQSIKILPDIFNAKMKAIKELADAINQDSTIENKQFRLAQILDERHQHLKTVLADVRKQLTEGENEQRAIQQYYNELAKKLRADEREQIRLKDVQYQPVEPKKISKPKSPSTKSVGTKETIEWANKLETEFPETKGKVASAMQVLILTKTAANPEAAYNILKGIYTENRNKQVAQ